MNVAVAPPRVFAPAIMATTAAEFDALMPALFSTGHRFELDHGTIVRMAPPGTPHSDQQSDLYYVIATAVRDVPGLRTNVELAVEVAGETVRVPDVVVRDASVSPPGMIGAAAVRLVVEVADKTLSEDLGVKALDYAQARIAEYWVVDVKARVVHIHTDPTAEGYGARSVVPFGAPMRALCLPTAIVFEG